MGVVQGCVLLSFDPGNNRVAAIYKRSYQPCTPLFRPALSGRRLGVVLGAAVAVVFFSGCARTSLFVPYTFRTERVRQGVREGRSLGVEKLFARETKGRDRLLYLLERGRVAQIQGAHSLSMREYMRAWQALRQLEDSPVFTATDAVAQSSAVVLNDNALSYRPAAYERVLRSHYQMLNYLLAGDVEGAGVEARRASAEQREAELRHDREVASIRDSRFGAWERQVRSESGLDACYRETDAMARQTEQSWVNPSTFYLSGLVFELLGQQGDAYIDYTKAVALAPQCRSARNDARRLARRLGLEDDLDRRLGARAAEEGKKQAAGHGGGWLVVLFDEGLVPVKEEVSLPIPLPGEDTWIMVAFPRYRALRSASLPLSVGIAGGDLGNTEPLGSTSVLAARALQEELPQRVIRHLLRSAAKGSAAKAAQDKYGWAGGLALGIFNTLTERADLRSWTTLPGWTQLLRACVPAGTHRVMFRHGQAGHRVALEVREGGTTLVYIVKAGDVFRADVACYDAGGTYGVSRDDRSATASYVTLSSGTEGKDRNDD